MKANKARNETRLTSPHRKRLNSVFLPIVKYLHETYVAISTPNPFIVEPFNRSILYVTLGNNSTLLLKVTH